MLHVALIACVLVFQALLLVKTSVSAGDGHMTISVVDGQSVKCLGGTDPGAPAHEHGPGSDCCLSCAPGASDESWLIAAAVTFVVSLLALALRASISVQFNEDNVFHPLRGLGSAWAARAPPLG